MFLGGKVQISRLPEEFLEEMQALLGEEYSAYLASLEERPMSGLRMNSLKADAGFARSRLKLSDPVPWTENGFYLTEESRFTKHPYYYAGLYYIQEPSAMSSAALLGTREGERVLDLCAAPGGKTTQIGADLNGRGVLVSNDLSASRSKALLKNVELAGIGNVLICCEDSAKLAAEYPLYFDRILVDAPCSGEGMFRKHPAVIRAWVEHGKDFYCPTQKLLLNDAARMLKPGGTLLYSTCTYNRREDEDQIEMFLSTHPDFTLDPIPLRPGFINSWILPGCVRLFPHHARAEGHFVARLKKQPAVSGDDGRYSTKWQRPLKKGELGDTALFFQKLRREIDLSRILVQGEYVLLIPETAQLHAGLRYLRTGLLLGQLKNGRFRPSQALAMNLRKEEWTDPIDLSADSPEVMRYLKGETIEASEAGQGYRLLCADGFPLGFVKQDRMRLKNMYLPGWRMQ